jgi:hypothetical protein
LKNGGCGGTFKSQEFISESLSEHQSIRLRSLIQRTHYGATGDGES